MASVQKRPGGKWRVRGKEPVYDPDTNAVARDEDGYMVMRDVYYGTFDNKPDAEAHRKKVDGELVTTGRTLDHAAGRETFEVYAGQWLEMKRAQARAGRIKTGTAEEYADLLRRYVLPRFAAKRIGTITSRHAEEFHASLVDRGLSRSTVKHGYDVFRWVLKYAVKQRAIGDNPAEGVDTGGRTTEFRFEGTPLSREQVAAVVGAVAERSDTYALAVRFLASTGLRAGEFAGLNVGDLRLVRKAGGGVRGSVRVDRTRKWKHGECAEGTPKSQKSRRTVPLPAGLAADLFAFLEVVHPDGQNADAPLWPNGTNARGGYRPKGSRAEVVLDWTRPIDPGAFYGSILLPAYRAAGVPEGTRLHDLRHTYGTLQLMAGEPYQKVSKWMGHSSYVVTLTVYAHWIEDDEEESTLDFVASAEQARAKGGNRPSDDNVVPLRAAR